MKRSEIKRGSMSFLLEKDELNDLFKKMVAYRMACRVETWVSENIHGVYATNSVHLTIGEAYNVAIRALKLIAGGNYTDIEYAIEDAYADVNPQPGHIIVSLASPDFAITRGNISIILSDEEKERITDNMLIVKFRSALCKEGKGEGKQLTQAAQKALWKLHQQGYTDIQDALDDAIDEVENDYFNYKLHQDLSAYDEAVCLADDHNAIKLGIDPDKYFDRQVAMA